MRLVRARGLSNPVDVKVFVIDSGDYSTMLFAEEYKGKIGQVEVRCLPSQEPK